MVKKEEKEIKYAEEGSDIILPDTSITSKRMLVLTNIADNQPYHGQMLPYLREITLNSKTNNSETTATFHTVLYLPLSSEHLSFVRIKLVDEFGRQLDFGNSETSVLLHFKPRLD